MTAAFTSRLPEWEAALAQALPSAARAMGEAAVQAVRAQMLTGYARPVYDTGALHADVRCRAEGASVLVGNTLPYAPMIGALIGFTALIPVVGAFIGGAAGAFLILMVSPVKALIFLVFLVVLQQLEGNLIYPRVVGTSIGLPGIWVLAVVTIGGGVFGIFGILIGIPLTAAVYRLIDRDMHRTAPSAEEAPE